MTLRGVEPTQAGPAKWTRGGTLAPCAHVARHAAFFEMVARAAWKHYDAFVVAHHQQFWTWKATCFPSCMEKVIIIILDAIFVVICAAAVQ